MAPAVPFIALAVTAASTVYSVYSTEQAGKAEKKGQEEAAAQARRAAEIEARSRASEHRQILASQRATYGGSGLTFEGSPLIVQFESMKKAEEELRNILEGGGIRASAYEAAGEEAQRAARFRSGQYAAGGLESTFKLGRMYNWW
jgi:hypothetical protein